MNGCNVRVIPQGLCASAAAAAPSCEKVLSNSISSRFMFAYVCHATRAVYCIAVRCFSPAMIRLDDDVLFNVHAHVGSSESWANPQRAVCRRVFDMRSTFSSVFFIASESTELGVESVRAAFKAQGPQLALPSLDIALAAVARGGAVKLFAFHAEAALAPTTGCLVRKGVVTAVTPSGRAFVALDDDDRVIEISADQAVVLDGGSVEVGCSVAVGKHDERSEVCDTVVLGTVLPDGRQTSHVFHAGRAYVMLPACVAGSALSPSADVAVAAVFRAAVHEAFARHCPRFSTEERRVELCRTVVASMQHFVADAVGRLACAPSMTGKFEWSAGTAAAVLCAVIDDATAARACGATLVQLVRILPHPELPHSVCAAVTKLAWRSPWLRNSLRHVFSSCTAAAEGIELLHSALLCWRNECAESMMDVAAVVDGAIVPVARVCASVGAVMRGDENAGSLTAAFARGRCTAAEEQYVRLLQTGASVGDGVIVDARVSRIAVTLAPTPNVQATDVGGLVHGLVPVVVLTDINGAIAAGAQSARAGGSLSQGLLAVAAARRAALSLVSVKGCMNAVEAVSSVSEVAIDVLGPKQSGSTVTSVDAVCSAVYRMSTSGEACGVVLSEFERACALVGDAARCGAQFSSVSNAVNTLAATTVTVISGSDDVCSRAVPVFFSLMRQLVKDPSTYGKDLVSCVVSSACAVACMLLSPFGGVPVVRTRESCHPIAAIALRESWIAIFGANGEGSPEFPLLRAFIASCGSYGSSVGTSSNPVQWCCGLDARSIAFASAIHGAAYLRELPRVALAVSGARDVTARAGTRRGSVAILVSTVSAACRDDGAVARALCVDSGLCECIAPMVHDDDISTRTQVVAAMADVLVCASQSFGSLDPEEESVWATLASAFSTSSCVSGFVAILSRGRDGEGMVHAATALRALLASGAGGGCGLAWNVLGSLVDGASAEKQSKLKRSVARGVASQCNEALRLIAGGDACAALSTVGRTSARLRAWSEGAGVPLVVDLGSQTPRTLLTAVVDGDDSSDAAVVARMAAAATRIDIGVRHMVLLAATSRNRDLQECGSMLWTAVASVRIDLAAGNVRDANCRGRLLAGAILVRRVVATVAACGPSALLALFDAGHIVDMDGSVAGHDGSRTGGPVPGPGESTGVASLAGLGALLSLARADIAVVPGVEDVARLVPFVILSAIADVLHSSLQSSALMVRGAGCVRAW